MKQGKLISAALAAICAALFALPSQAQQPARIFSGFAPGGAVDILARLFAERWTESLGRPVIVESRTGAGGTIAMEAVKNAAPDGNTLILTPDSALVVYPHTVAKPLYNSLTDFTPILLTGTGSIALGISAKVPASNLAEFIAWAKANPREASFGSSGAGSSLQFFGNMISQVTGAPMTHVPYRGVGPTIADLVAGQIAAGVLPTGTLVPQVKAGKARLLAHSGSRRSASAPDVPTFRELGYNALEAPSWFGIFGPAGMRPELVAQLHDTLLQAMRSPALRARMESLDLQVEEITPAQLAAKVRADYSQWEGAVRASGWDRSKH